MITRRFFFSGVAATASIGHATVRRDVTMAWATLDNVSGRAAGSNVNVRVPMCSTFKWLLAACVLARVDRGLERLDRPVAFGPADLRNYAPTVGSALAAAGGSNARLSVAALCEAAVTLSDNSAANLLLPSVGGPAGLTAWLRTTGDRVTRLDRTEPSLNRVPPGDPRDTTTPAAMVATLEQLLFGPTLTPSSRRQLLAWLIGCKTGDTRLRAGLPAGWRIGHKTGTYATDRPTRNDRNAAGDVGLLLPPSGKPILIAAYIVGSRERQPITDRWFAGLAREAVARRIG